MSDPDSPVTESAGIYAECPDCGALVANQQLHETWHLSHDEGVNDGIEQP